MKRPSTLIVLLILVLLSSGAFIGFDNHKLSGKRYTLKMLSYNIHHASPPSKPDSIDLDAIAQVINDLSPDLVALQEVDVFTGRSGPYNQAEELGQRTGMAAYFFKAIDYDGGEYGLAILSRLPVMETNRYPLPSKEGSDGEPRILATALIELSSREKLLFACTHLDAQRDSTNRELQIRAIDGLLKDSAVPVIIAGDFNASPASHVIQSLDKNFTRTCDPCEFTIPVDKPTRAIDFIAFSPANAFKVLSHRVIPERYASDHLPVFSVLETP